MLTAALLINITLSSVTANVSSYSRLYGHFFNYSLLHTFEFVCFVLLPSYERDKLSFRTGKCIFLGFYFAHKEYQCYDSTTKCLRIAWHISSFENVSYYQSSHIQDLYFFDTIITETFTHPVPTYTPSLASSISSSPVSLIESSPSLWMFLLLILYWLWLLWLPRVISLLFAEIHHATITLLANIVSLLTQHILLSFHHLFLRYILYKNLSLFLRL